MNDQSMRRQDLNLSDFRSRYWTFLFDNLRRSIEQIYQTCESDQNPHECQVRQEHFFLSQRFLNNKENIFFRKSFNI